MMSIAHGSPQRTGRFQRVGVASGMPPGYWTCDTCSASYPPTLENTLAAAMENRVSMIGNCAANDGAEILAAERSGAGYPKTVNRLSQRGAL